VIRLAEVEVRKLDPQGRLLIPPEWRRDVLKNSSEVIVMKFKDHIKLTPLTRKSLTEFFDIVEIDVSPAVFVNYHDLRAFLMRKRYEVR
jgi:bifunctional DNA-binding transcriptional regulator/antitoxin component of YhaV-PrlF toxin-antitoxin module